MKYIFSLIIGVGIAYIQSVPSRENFDFALGVKPVMLHYVVVTLFSFIAGLIVSYQLNKVSEKSDESDNRFVDEFTVILTVAFGVGVLRVMSGSDSFMGLITPYLAFSFASGLVGGKCFHLFNERNLTRK